MLERAIKEALSDSFALVSRSEYYEARCLYGVKIVIYKSGNVRIYNTTLGEYYYEEVSCSEMEYFKRGWRYGVYRVAMNNAEREINRLSKFALRHSEGSNIYKSIQKEVKQKEEFLQKIKSKLNLIQ